LRIAASTEKSITDGNPGASVFLVEYLRELRSKHFVKLLDWSDWDQTDDGVQGRVDPAICSLS
jgi:hypothetical protein